jgi:hypothetical protein
MLFQFPEQYLVYETVPRLLYGQEETAGKKNTESRPEQGVIESDTKAQASTPGHPD